MNTKYYRYLFASLIAVGSILIRVLYPTSIEYKADQIQTIEVANSFLIKPHFLTKGPPSSWGFSYFPLFYFGIIPLQYIFSDPLLVTLTIATLNGVVIGIFFFFTSDVLGIRVALISSLLWATSPWMIRYSRIIWAPSMQLLLLPFIYSLLLHKNQVFTNTKTLFVGIYIALFLQIYPSSLLFVPVLLLFLNKKTFSPWHIGGFLIGLLPSIAYLFSEFFQNALCPSCQQVVTIISQQRSISWTHITKPFQLLGALGFQEVIGGFYNQILQQSFLLLLLPLLWMLSGLAAGFGMYSLVRQKRYLVVFYLYLVTGLFYSIAGAGSYMHYHLVLAPGIFISFAYTLNLITTMLPNPFHLFPLLFAAALIIGNTTFVLLTYEKIYTQKYVPGDYGEIYESRYSRAKPFIEAYKTNQYSPEIQTIAFMGNTPTTINIMLITFFINRKNFAEAKIRIAEVENQQNLSQKEKELLHLLKQKLPEAI